MAFLDYTGLSRFKSKLDALFTKGPSSSTSNGVAIFGDTGGKTLKDSGFTIGKSVPSDAKFTDTTYSAATISANGLMSSDDKTKLNGIDVGAEVNQNAFSNVVVGNTTVSADSKTDTLTLVAGSNVTLTPDATNDKITIDATDTWRPVSDSVSSTSSSDAASSKAVKTAYDLANGKVSCTTANVKTALGTGSGATKFFREDGTWDVPPGARPYIVALDTVTNTSGSYTHTTSVANIRDDMKPIQIECSNPDAFQDKVSITTGDGSITLTCANVIGTSSVTVTVMESASAEQGIPGQVTSSEFNTLASRIGTLSQLETTNKSDLVSATNELNGLVTDLSNSIIDMVYPVGSIYMSVASTSPATLFGGTWEQLKDRFLLGAGDTYTAGNTSGAASQSYTPAGSVGNHTLTIAEIPSHAHGLNSHVHSVGAHSHGLNSHTHGVGSYEAASGGKHDHGVQGYYQSSDSGGSKCTAYKYISSDAEASGSSSPITKTGSSHTHSISGTSGAASGSTAKSTAFDSGAATGNTANNGSGGAHNHSFTGTAATIATMPPYLAVYMWKRTA